MKQKAVICDLDSTLADCHHRLHHIVGCKKKDWKSFNEKSLEDKPYPWTLNFLKAMWFTDHKLLFVTGRSDDERSRTMEWLVANVHLLDNDFGYSLYMRRAGDYRKALQVKREIYEEQIHAHYDVVVALDDDPTVCEMYHALGINVMRVMAQPEYLREGI